MNDAMQSAEMKKTARATGLWYLGLAVFGAVGYLGIRSQLYAPNDAAATAANLVSHESLARLGIAADLALIVTQSLAALYFLIKGRQRRATTNL